MIFTKVITLVKNKFVQSNNFKKNFKKLTSILTSIKSALLNIQKMLRFSTLI